MTAVRLVSNSRQARCHFGLRNRLAKEDSSRNLCLFILVHRHHRRERGRDRHLTQPYQARRRRIFYHPNVRCHLLRLIRDDGTYVNGHAGGCFVVYRVG